MAPTCGRRDLLRSGGAATALALAGCSGLTDVLPGGSSGTSSWHMFQGGPAHTGVASDGGPGADLDERWTAEVTDFVEMSSAQARDRYVSAPVCADGTVFATLTLRAAVSPGFGHHLLAIDASDGSLEWRTTLAEEYTGGHRGLIAATPTIVEDLVIVPLTGSPPDAMVAVDRTTGDVEWVIDTARFNTTSATAGGGQVVVGGRTAYAVDTAGEDVWETTADGINGAAASEPPTVTADTTYVTTVRGLLALDDEGEERWRRDLAFESEMTGVGMTPNSAAVDSSVYVVSDDADRRGDGRLFALDPGSGETEWEFQPEFDPARRAQMMQDIVEEFGRTPPWSPGVGVYRTPVVADGRLYVPGTTLVDADGELPLTTPRLFAIDAGSGEKLWSAVLPDMFRPTPPALGDGVVYVATNAGVVAVDPNEGEVLETGDCEGAEGHLALGSDAVYASTRGDIVALGP